MSGTEWGVVLVGLVCGYWLVSFWRGPSTPPPLPRDGECSAMDLVQEPAWHTVLEVDPLATQTAIEAAYQQQMGLYHPDKVASLGPELQALAATKVRQIEAAYRAGLLACGPAP